MAAAKRPKHFPVMAHMTVKDIREYLADNNSIIIPVGVMEQHGYHLPLCTDAALADNLGRLIGIEADVLVAPTMYESFSGGGLPGTMNISPAVMSLVISDLLISLVGQGFENLFVLLCHGGSENARALDNAIQMLLRNNPAFEKVMVALMGVWDFGPRKNGLKQGFAEGDWHAGWAETSLMMALEPDLVQMDKMELDDEPWRSMQIEHPDNYQHAEKIVDDKHVVPRIRQRPQIKVGAMGYPERASAELGKKMVDGIVADAAGKIKELLRKADGNYKEVAFTPEPLLFDLD